MSEFVRYNSAAGGTVGFRLRLRGPVARRHVPEPVMHAADGAAPGAVCITRAELAHCDAWPRAFAGHYKDHRYYEMVEDTLHPEFKHRYFMFRDAAGRVAGVQPFFILDQDLLTGTGGRLASLTDFIRRRWPGFLRMRTLMVGCVAGEGHLAAGVDADELATAALAAAREHKAGLVVLKEFPAMYRHALKPLRVHRYQRLPSLPMTSLDIAYRDFDDYMNHALSRGTRKDLRRKFKAARDAGIEMSVVNDITPYVDEAYPLYLQVYNRSPLHFEKLTKEYLRELGRRLPETTRYFIWRQNGRMVAFNLCTVLGDTIYDQYIGLDYSVALDLHLYHYTFRDIISWAIEHGCKQHVSNGLNYDPKLHLKCRLEPLDLYVRHTSPVINAILKLVLPWLEPTRYDKHLKKFSNYSELWGHP